jgi:hypothetical protein
VRLALAGLAFRVYSLGFRVNVRLALAGGQGGNFDVEGTREDYAPPPLELIQAVDGTFALFWKYLGEPGAHIHTHADTHTHTDTHTLSLTHTRGTWRARAHTHTLNLQISRRASTWARARPPTD